MLVSALCCGMFYFFFFKQKTAYEMRISDWSSDVCSSDLYAGQFGDLLSDAHIAAERAAAEDDLKQLALIDRARLSSTDQVIYDTFKWQRTLDLRSEESRVGNACVYV